jgi:hypothetical protein
MGRLPSGVPPYGVCGFIGQRSLSKTKFAIQTTSTAGIVIMAFGILCIWIGSSIKLGRRRFLIAGLNSIGAHMIRYFVFRSAYIKYISKQIRYRRNHKQNKFRD